jgi:hypothetical protein
MNVIFCPTGSSRVHYVHSPLWGMDSRRGARTRKQSNDQNEFWKENTGGETKYDVKVVCKSLRKVL